MKKRKITITTGTRADYGFLRPVLNAISASSKLEYYLIVTGMHLSKKHGKSISEIKVDGFRIYDTIDMMPHGNTNYHMSLALADGIKSFSKIFKKCKPEINLVFGDRDEQLASAIAAYHMNIPNAHIHGGDVSGGIDEYNRHAITKMSNIHFAATKKSKNRIVRMGENPKNVFFTGSPAIDAIYRKDISTKKELEKKYDLQIKGNEILLLFHPVTTESHKSETQIIAVLDAIKKLKMNTIAIAPNNDAGNYFIFKHLESYSKKYEFIHLYPNLPRKDFLGFLKYFGALVGNSSSGLIEGTYFRIPVVNVGIRQKNREKGKNIIDIQKISSKKIQETLKNILKNSKKVNKNSVNTVYGTGNASLKIVKILEITTLGENLIQKQLLY